SGDDRVGPEGGQASRSGVLLSRLLGQLLEVNAAHGPRRGAIRFQERVLGTDLLHEGVEADLGAPSEDDEGRGRLVLPHRLVQRCTAFEEGLDVLGDVTRFRIAGVEKDLDRHGPRFGPFEFGHRGRLGSLGRFALPTGALLDRVLLGVELERDLTQVSAAGRGGLLELDIGLLELASHHRRQPPAPGRPTKPWWAISRVSVATLAESRLSCGPVHLTGITSMSDQEATLVPSLVMAVISAVARTTLVAMLEIHRATFSLSLVTGRVSLMLVYLIRPGS